jgi:hypothetical protein
MLHVYAGQIGEPKHVAIINQQPKAADGYTPETPWLLLHNTGRIDRFATLAEARLEAVKSWPRVVFKKS